MVERDYGRGYNVRVSFSRGRLRVVDGSPLLVSRVRRVVVVSLVEVSELEVVVPSDGLMSVVTGGLVLVTVWVVVVADEEWAALDAVGSSTKYCGA
ncbi:MAG TPA: hypothetical protein VGO30_25930 [Mycobacterium sp.]|jgi:hypothetical protein|nr:hypothetical protein [Mycobacterium sp.]